MSLYFEVGESGLGTAWRHSSKQSKCQIGIADSLSLRYQHIVARGRGRAITYGNETGL